MSTDFHTPYVDGITKYTDTLMNVPLGELDTAIGAINAGDFDIKGSAEGKPATSAVLTRIPFPRAVAYSSGMPYSQMVAGVAATAETVFSLKNNGVEFATATFAIGGTVAPFASAGKSFVTGEVLTMVAPGSQDATLSDLGWCIVGGHSLAGSTTTSTSTSTTTTPPP
jgi:hypothetical protein